MSERTVLFTSVLSRRGLDKSARSHRQSGEAAAQVQLRIHPGRLQHVSTANGSSFDSGVLRDVAPSWLYCQRYSVVARLQQPDVARDHTRLITHVALGRRGSGGKEACLQIVCKS